VRNVGWKVWAVGGGRELQGGDPCSWQRTGQFWARTTEEALLGEETFWRNERPAPAVAAQPPHPGVQKLK